MVHALRALHLAIPFYGAFRYDGIDAGDGVGRFQSNAHAAGTLAEKQLTFNQLPLGLPAPIMQGTRGKLTALPWPFHLPSSTPHAAGFRRSPPVSLILSMAIFTQPRGRQRWYASSQASRVRG